MACGWCAWPPPRPKTCTAPAGYVGCAHAVVNIDLDAQLPRIGCPTLVIVGREDVATPPEMAQVIAQTIPGARLVELDAAARAAHGSRFVELTPPQRLALVERFDREAFQFMRGRPADEPPHWFRMLKELTLLGFFTSEVGMTQALRYVESPGRFDPCVPYAPGDRDWAAHA